MTTPSSYNTWIIEHYLKDSLSGTELSLQNRPAPAATKGQLVIKTHLLSLDASNLLWLSEKKDYLPQLQIGEPMRGNIIGEIIHSDHPSFGAGQFIAAMLHWADYHFVNGDELLNAETTMRFTPHPEVPLDAYVGTLGITGWSAYIGLVNVGKLKAGERVLISGAAGATGIMAVQLAKAAGAEVYAMAGGAEKCRYLQDTFQLAGTIDYKATNNLRQGIADAIPKGIEVFFDNVGGEILDASLPNMCINGRILASGSVSQYGKAEKYGVKNLPLVTTKRLRMEGFLILDHLQEVPEVLKTMETWLLEGRLINKNQSIQGLENAQAALTKLISGGNIGKLVVEV